MDGWTDVITDRINLLNLRPKNLVCFTWSSVSRHSLSRFLLHFVDVWHLHGWSIMFSSLSISWSQIQRPPRTILCIFQNPPFWPQLPIPVVFVLQFHQDLSSLFSLQSLPVFNSLSIPESLNHYLNLHCLFLPLPPPNLALLACTFNKIPSLDQSTWMSLLHLYFCSLVLLKKNH